MGFGSIQLGFGLLVKVEAVVILGEVKVYISVLLYSNKLELFSVLRHVGHTGQLFFFLSLSLLYFLSHSTIHGHCSLVLLHIYKKFKN